MTGDIHVKYDEDGTPMFRMEGYPRVWLEEVIPGRDTGLLDIDGCRIFDGDTVLNLNIPGTDQVCEVRLLRYSQDRFAPMWTAGGASIEGFAFMPEGRTLSQHPRYGVKKMVKQ